MSQETKFKKDEVSVYMWFTVKKILFPLSLRFSGFMVLFSHDLQILPKLFNL